MHAKLQNICETAKTTLSPPPAVPTTYIAGSTSAYIACPKTTYNTSYRRHTARLSAAYSTGYRLHTARAIGCLPHWRFGLPSGSLTATNRAQKTRCVQKTRNAVTCISAVTAFLCLCGLVKSAMSGCRQALIQRREPLRLRREPQPPWRRQRLQPRPQPWRLQARLSSWRQALPWRRSWPARR